MANKYIKNNGNGNFKVNIPFEINTYDTWSVETKIAISNQLNDCVLMTTEETDGSNKNNFKVDILNQHLVLSISLNGDTYITAQSGYILNINNTYYIKLSFSGTTYTVDVSTDGTTYTTYAFIENSYKLYSNSANVIFIPTIDSTYFNGKLDINSTKLIGDSTTIFNGEDTNSSGYYNHNTTINSGIVSGFSENNYIQCNGFELNNYVKIITRINLNNVTSRQTLIYNGNNYEIYIRSGKIWLFDETGQQSSSLQINKNYYIGYIYSKNVSSQFQHELYYMEDTGYYSSFSELPDFENFTNAISDNVKKPVYTWNKVGSKILDENVFKGSIYLGSNKNTYLNGTIDLNNTIISNNVATYKLTKLGYIPYVGTKVLNQSLEKINPELSKLEKLVITAQDTDSQPINNISVTFNTNGLNYYQLDPNEPNCIYVLPGTQVSFKVNSVGYNENNESVTVVETQDHITNYISILGTLVTLTINVTNEDDVDVTNSCTFNFSTNSQVSYVQNNTIQVVSGSDVYYNIYHPDYKRYPVSGNAEIRMGLTDQTENVELSYYSLTVNSSTSGATVTLSATGYTTVSGLNTATIRVKKNTRVTWLLQKTGYDNKTNEIVVLNDTVSQQSLSPSQVTLTVQPTPNTATVKIYNNGTLIKTGTGNTSATVDYGSNLTYTITANGCNTYNGTVNNITENTTKNNKVTVTIPITTTPYDASVTNTTGSGATKYWTADYGTTSTLTVSKDCFASQNISVVALPGNNYNANLSVNVNKSGNFSETTFTVPSARTLYITLNGGGNEYYIYNSQGTSTHKYLNGGIVTAALNVNANSRIKFKVLQGGGLYQSNYHGGHGIALYYNDNLVLVAPGSGGGMMYNTLGHTTYYYYGGGGYDGGASANQTSSGATNIYAESGTSLTGNYNKALTPANVLCYGQACGNSGTFFYGLGGTGYVNNSYISNYNSENGVYGTSGHHGNNEIIITE